MDLEQHYYRTHGREESVSTQEEPLPENRIPLQQTTEQGHGIPSTPAEGFGGTIPPDEQTHSYRIEGRPDLRKRLIRWIGGITAATVVAGTAIGYGVKSMVENTEPKQEPSVSAPAFPGEQPMPETAPSAELSMSNYAFEHDGKTYQGVTELEQGIGIQAETGNPDGEQVVRSAVDGINLWMNYGTANKQERDKYEGYLSRDGQRIGLGAAIQDAVNPAFEQVFTADSNAEGASVQSFIDNVNDLHLQNAAYGINTTNDTVPYEATYKPTGPINVHVATAEHISATVPVKFEDNGDENSMGQLRTEDSTGFDGITDPQMSYEGLLMHLSLEQYNGQWKITSANIEQ